MFDDQLSAVPTQPPRTGVLPGMRLRAAIPRSSILTLLALVAFFALFPVMIASTDPQMKLNVGPARTAEGQVVSNTEGEGCRSGVGRRVVYTFSSESGNEFRGSTVLCPESPYYSAREGEKIEVRYLSRDPSLNRVADGNANNEPPIFVFFIFPFFFLIVLSPLYFPQVREVLRARRLYKTAEVIQGQVVFVKRRSVFSWPGWPGSSTADVFVSYVRAGSRAEVIAACNNEWLLNQLEPGTSVRVLASARKSERGVLLEAYIR
jgi:hypothetical protein